VRKQKQIEHAATISHEAKIVKLADKIANLTDILDSPPSDWSMERKNEYFQWAKAVVNNLRGTHSGLEKDFDSLVMAQEYISALNKAIKEDN
jgi:guanosine-3',5'-bis(diphosphate) 3'-pyrophosphohydrolase